MLERYMMDVRDMGLHEKCFIMIGVGPLASARAAKWIRSNVPGIHIPDSIIDRLEGAEDQKLEGKKICIEMLQQVHEMEGVSGAHVMAYRQEELVAEIVHESGVLKGRKPWKRENNPDFEAVADTVENTKEHGGEAINPSEVLAAVSD
ncbi:MAG: methylenetetrahydrofolate reductase [Sneathiella sp.]|nr:methylenetetrahydrofolate reductase [Sneathiella sp.]